MKYLLLSLFLTINTLNIHAQTGSIQHLDEENGYGGIRLGDTITDLKIRVWPAPGTSPKHEGGLSKYKVMDNSLLMIDDEPVLSDIFIICFDDKILEVHITFNPKKMKFLKKALRQRFGEPTLPASLSMGEFEVWETKNVAMRLFLKPSPFSDYILDYSNPTLDKLFRQRRADNDKNVDSKF